VASLPEADRLLLTRRFGLDGEAPARLRELRPGASKQAVHEYFTRRIYPRLAALVG
jgi:hypothetical protein